MATKQSLTHDLTQFINANKAQHDACGIVATAEKNNLPTKHCIDLCIDALNMLDHRAGFIDGEGDGIGIHMDIPRSLWKEKLISFNQDPDLVDLSNFGVGHFFIEKDAPIEETVEEIKNNLVQFGCEILSISMKETDTSALGPIGLKEEPFFLQVSFLVHHQNEYTMDSSLFDATLQIEENLSIHVASLSRYHVVYKVLGAGTTLRNFYYDLENPKIASRVTLGHNRYSTNTLPSFFRVQPFSLLGHNGEINTITKLREEATMIDFTLVHGGSDSQDLNRVIESMVATYNMSLFEALEIVFPPIYHEIKLAKPSLQSFYTKVREAWGHFAQGPAGIVSRYGDEAVFSVDSLGLRPLWMLETETQYIFCSEQGIIPATEFVSEPKPLSPGEKVGLLMREDEPTEVVNHTKLQELVFERMKSRLTTENLKEQLFYSTSKFEFVVPNEVSLSKGDFSAYGWNQEQIQFIKKMAEDGADPIRSLGHDVPLAALDHKLRNISDFIKETVAVVTNPAIDREREIEHFSTRVIVGKRPALKKDKSHFVQELVAPVVIQGKQGLEIYRDIQQPSYEQLLHHFKKNDQLATFTMELRENENIIDAMSRMEENIIDSINDGKSLIVLDDFHAMDSSDSLWIDPAIVIAHIHQSLVHYKLRRKCSLLIRSGAIRNLHDILVMTGLGADVVNPYAMFQIAGENGAQGSAKLWKALQKGLEKAASTLGIHEFRGYTKQFSSIGLHNEIANILGVPNYFGGDQVGYSFEKLKEDAFYRREVRTDEAASLARPTRFLPKVWKAVHNLATSGDYGTYEDHMKNLETDVPTAIRHLLAYEEGSSDLGKDDVKIGIGDHELPFVISSMSFGSQNETPFRAYAEAAKALNMISLSGEGGEPKAMLAKYGNTRGIQIASGRFGINGELLNSVNIIEIKIGQGAKPGEGGHLPGSKVTNKIAEARFTTLGADLISPSNNHDIYSIEDLAQMVYEVKRVNPKARVIIKVPIVPNIGTIAIGIAKSGADIISLSGFDGGTGAARIHAIENVGLPIEIGVKAAHNALLDAGIRHLVEIWADGGVKTADDVVKLSLLGANRVGFGTLAMMAVGCTACRSCHLDSCHVGIATQMETVEDAKERGLRKFNPRELGESTDRLVTFFRSMGDGVREICARLGITNLQDAVGDCTILKQYERENQLNLETLTKSQWNNTYDNRKVINVLEPRQPEDIYGEDGLVLCKSRSIGAPMIHEVARENLFGTESDLSSKHLTFEEGSIGGNGFGAYLLKDMSLTIKGGAEDSVGKSLHGGNIHVLKTKGKDGRMVDGSVGKAFGYGAQEGWLIAQGNADARAGIRLSGADMIIGGRVSSPVDNHHGHIGNHSNIKGFAFEYMTNGRGLVLGDPGPWMCAGMTGGVIYVRNQPEMGLTINSIWRRMSKGAKVDVQPLSEKGKLDVVEMLNHYISVLEDNGQSDEVLIIKDLLAHPEKNFIQIVPAKYQGDVDYKE